MDLILLLKMTFKYTLSSIVTAMSLLCALLITLSVCKCALFLYKQLRQSKFRLSEEFLWLSAGQDENLWTKEKGHRSEFESRLNHFIKAFTLQKKKHESASDKESLEENPPK